MKAGWSRHACTRAAAAGKGAWLAALAVASAAAGAADAPELAITFDDLPAHSALPEGETRLAIARSTIDALKAAGVPQVYGFVNGIGAEREPESAGVLPLWRAAGFPLGNHTWSHLALSALSPADYEAEIARNEPLLAAQAAGTDWHWFRYPFLDEGNDSAKRATIRQALARGGYRIAAVTMSFGDYAFNEPYARCVAAKDQVSIAALEKGYLDAARAAVRSSRAMSQALYGRDIPYVLLMHIGAFDARMLPRLLTLYKAEGFRFVTLPEAERDPAYAADLNPALPARAASLEARLAEKGLPMPKPAYDLSMLDNLCRSGANQTTR